MEFDLLEKTELRFEQIDLHGADLNRIAATIADVLGLHRDDVLVIDAINNTLSIDLLCKTIDPYALLGKKEVLFDRMKRIPNLGISARTTIHSEEILGWIAMDEAEGERALKASQKMAADMGSRLEKRGVVFSTGQEVITGQIVDTNQPAIKAALTAEGYTVTRGPALKDDSNYIAGMIRNAIDQDGYRLVITTGGVGAESKDHAIEALIRVDPDAATPYICMFEKGQGRHMKEGIRIGVGERDGSLMVVLPGPNDEVRASLPIVVECLENGEDKHAMAEKLARNLRGILRRKMYHHA